MLNSFRSFSGSLATKILLVLLIASFAMWGVGDMLTRSASNHTIATVGKEEIMLDAYQREYARQSDQVRRDLGASYSRELLRRLNVPQFVLKRMVQESLLHQEAERMGFIPDDTTVALEIRKNPAFLNLNGVFDKVRFETSLRNQGITEKIYIEQLRTQMANDQLLEALAVDLPVTDQQINKLNAAFQQGRVVSLYRLSAEGLPPVAVADEETLKAFHQEYGMHFIVPEYRTVSYVQFSATDAQQAITPPQEEAIQSYYDEHQEQFATPEKRNVNQLLYNTKEKAQQAYDAVQQGQSFKEIIANIQPMNQENISLGLVGKKELLEDAAEEVFQLGKGYVTQPIKSPFGWHIFQVVAIQPAGIKPLGEVRATIEEQLTQSQRDDALINMMNQLEDALAGGSTLAEAAKELGLPLRSAGTFDRQGMTSGSNTKANIPALDKFVEVAFSTEEQTESSVITAQGGNYYVVRVDKIIPETLPPYDTIRSEVVAAHLHHQAEQKVSKITSAIEQALQEKKPAEEIIATYPMKLVTKKTIYRHSSEVANTILLPSFVQQIFTTDIGDLTPPHREKNGSYLFAYVHNTAPAKHNGLSDSERAGKRKELVNQMQEEMMMQYIDTLQHRYPVRINEAIFTQVMEASDDAPR